MMFVDVFELLCAQKGISVSKACDDMGFSRSTISNWRKQKKAGIAVQPDVATLKKISDYFGEPVSHLLIEATDDPFAQFFQNDRPPTRLHDEPMSLADYPVFSEKELLLIDAYRRNPDAQKFVDRVLGLEENK